MQLISDSNVKGWIKGNLFRPIKYSPEIVP